MAAPPSRGRPERGVGSRATRSIRARARAARRHRTSRRCRRGSTRPPPPPGRRRLAHDNRTEALGDRVLDRVTDAAGHGHAGHDYGSTPCARRKPAEIRAVERAGALLHDHLLARVRARCARRSRLRPFRAGGPRGDLVMPEAHVRVRALGDRVGRPREDHRDLFRPRRAEQALNAGNDASISSHVNGLPARVHALARSMFTGPAAPQTRPGA